jgi:hypothetical protein
MKRLALVLLVPLSCFGCRSLTHTPTVKDVSTAVGRPVSIEYTRGPGGWETRNGGVIVRMDDRWLAEPCIYHWGAVAGLACSATGADREFVADALGLPLFAMWDGDLADSKIMATKQQARIEQTMFYQSPSNEAPGWPTNRWK